MSDAVVELEFGQQLSFAQIARETFRLYTTHARPLITASLLVVVPASLAMGAFLDWVAYLIAGGVTAVLTSQAILGRPLELMPAYQQTFRRLWALLVASVLSFLAILVLFMTIIGIPWAVYRALGWVLLVPAIVIEELSWRQGLARSSELVKGHRLRLANSSTVFGLLEWLLPALALGLVGLVYPAWEDNSLVAEILPPVGIAVFLPLIFIALTIHYYELRALKAPPAELPPEGAPVIVPSPAIAAVVPAPPLHPLALQAITFVSAFIIVVLLVVGGVRLLATSAHEYPIAQDHAEEAIAHLILAWDDQEYLNRASPELLRETPVEEARNSIKEIEKNLGAMKEYQGIVSGEMKLVAGRAGAGDAGDLPGARPVRARHGAD